jgi:hypothetical protein
LNIILHIDLLIDRYKKERGTKEWTQLKMNLIFPILLPIHEHALNIPKENFLARLVHFLVYISLIIRFLFKGGFARCYELIDTSNGQTFAGKVVPKSMLVKPHQKEKV